MPFFVVIAHIHGGIVSINVIENHIYFCWELHSFLAKILYRYSLCECKVFLTHAKGMRSGLCDGNHKWILVLSSWKPMFFLSLIQVETFFFTCAVEKHSRDIYSKAGDRLENYLASWNQIWPSRRLWIKSWLLENLIR